MDQNEILKQKIYHLYRKKIKNYITNCYGEIDKEMDLYYEWESEDALIFSTSLDDVRRIYFAGEKQTIVNVLQAFQKKNIMELVTRRTKEVDWAEEIGYKRFLTLQRCHKTSFEHQEIPKSSLEISIASLKHMEQIKQGIYDNFHFIHASYMCDTKLRENIVAGTVWIATNKTDDVEAFLIASKNRSTLCVEFLYNGCVEFKAGYFLKIAENYALTNKMKLVYAWRDVTNERAISMYHKNGFEPEERYKFFLRKE